MKKLIAMLLVLITLAAPALAETPMIGGWNVAEETTVTDEIRALLEKALEGFVGSDFEPVAYLGSQIVAGTNHCILCQRTVVYPGAQPVYTLVYLYEKLDGTVEILTMCDLDLTAFAEKAE